MTELKAGNRRLWNQVPAAIKKQAIKEAEPFLDGIWTPIALSLFQEFTKTGDRSRFQQVYFEKRLRLSQLVIAECLEYEGRFIPQIAEGIWSLLSEPAWVIPAHNSYIRDTPQLPCPLTERPILDLFACETGEILALTVSILEEELRSSIGEELIRTTMHQLKTRILIPYLTDHFWWMGGAGDKLNNWTVWCTQNILLACLTMPLSADERKLVVQKAADSLDLWLEQYGEDGCCDEGASYWHAAGLCFWGCVHILDKVCEGVAAPLFSAQKIRNIGAYIINVHVQDDKYLNFADCSPKAGLLGVREYLFGKAIQDDRLIRQALIDWNGDFDRHLMQDRPATSRDPGDNNYNLWYRLLDCQYASEMRTATLPPPRQQSPFIWYQSTGLAIYRFNGYTLAVKAGCNDDSHNHNDVGSLILYHGTHPLLIDVGVETYTARTFGPQRYTLWPMQSHYHNVCNFAEVMQNAGPRFKATEVHATEQGISMELKDAYPPEAELHMYKRSVTSLPNGIMVKENIRGRISPTLSIMTMDKPVIETMRIVFPHWTITYDGTVTVSSEELAIDDSRLKQAWPDKLYRTLVSFTGDLVWKVESQKDVNVQ